MNQQTTWATHLALIAACVLSTACGSSGVSGDWTSGCVSTGSASERRTFKFDGNSFTQVLTQYSPSTTCTGSLATTTYMGTFTEIKSTVNEKFNNIDFTYTTPAGTLPTYDIYEIIDSKLYFGEISSANDKTTAAKRPTTIGTTYTFSKN